MLSGLKRCRAPPHSSHSHAQTNIMFELFLARVCAADLTGQAHRRCMAELTTLPARFIPFILRAFSLFVMGQVALAGMGVPTGNTRLQTAAS